MVSTKARQLRRPETMTALISTQKASSSTRRALTIATAVGLLAAIAFTSAPPNKAITDHGAIASATPPIVSEYAPPISVTAVDNFTSTGAVPLASIGAQDQTEITSNIATETGLATIISAPPVEINVNTAGIYASTSTAINGAYGEQQTAPDTSPHDATVAIVDSTQLMTAFGTETAPPLSISS